jgi:hypothetical protein
MSHGPQFVPNDRPIPVSKGLPRSMQMLLVIAVIVVFIMGSTVVISSNFGRVWPSADSAKVPLPAGH